MRQYLDRRPGLADVVGIVQLEDPPAVVGDHVQVIGAGGIVRQGDECILVDEITRLRIELLGLSFTAQHSDARVLDQVVYKWHHFRQVLSGVLLDHYSALADTGWQPTRAEIERDVKELFGGAFTRFVGN